MAGKIDPTDPLYKRYIEEEGWTYTFEQRGGKWFTLWSDEDGQPRCGAKRTNKDSLCRNAPKSNGRCRKHGGNMPRGAEHHLTTHGRYSAYWPEGLRQRFEEMAGDESLLDLRQNVAVLDVRLSQLLEHMDTDAYGKQWEQLAELWKQANRAKKLENSGAFDKMWLQMGRIVEAGADDYETWKQIIHVNDKRREMVKTAEEIRLKGERAVSIEDLMLVMVNLDNLFQRINRLVDAEERRREFSSGLGKIISINNKTRGA